LTKKFARNAELVSIKGVREQLEKIFKAVEKGFQDQADRSDETCDWWDIWNCKLGTNQYYAGQSKVFLPLVRNAIKARKTRFVNQLFPQSNRNVAVISHDGENPDAQVSLCEHYIRRDKLRSVTIPALMVAGDVEGQMTVVVSWTKYRRNVVDKIPEPIRVLGIDLPPEVAEPVEKTRESEFYDAGPSVEIVLDADVCILPATSDTIEEALECGGSVTIIRRWSKERLQELIDEGELRASSTEQLIGAMKQETLKDQEKKNLDAAGIKARGEHALVYRTWCKIEVPGEKEKRLVLAYWAGGDHYLSCRLCPYWCDLPDVISHARDKLPGNIKGQSQIKPGVADMQYGANDAINEGLDQLTYRLLPPLRYDPNLVPNVDGLVMDLMSLWPAPAGAIETIKFENTLGDALEAVGAAERMINMALSVTPAMMPQLPTNKKMSQAEMSQAQQVDILQTADVATETEEAMMTEIVRRFMAYDLQFRDRELAVRAYGEFGLDVEMVRVPALQNGHRWEYSWYGVEANRTVQQVQQQIAAANVINGMSQHQSVAQSGKRVNLVPLIQLVVESAFNPRIGGKIFEDITETLAVPQALENQMLALGHDVPVSPLDNDVEHLKELVPFLQSLQPGTPPYQQASAHAQRHQAAMRTKQAAQMMGQMNEAQGNPGGQPRGRRGPRQPQPGSQPAMPRQGRQPPGALHTDQMAKAGSVVPMPRRMG
jgi:hypothetical protein